MQVIINQAITTAWADIEIDSVRTTGEYMFWARGGGAFRIRVSGTANYATIAANQKVFIDSIHAIGGVLFQAQTVSGTDTIELVIY
jgi:hypothetical protein